MKQTAYLLIIAKQSSKHAIHHKSGFNRYASINIQSKTRFAHLSKIL